jgi:Zn-dependent peptidase ImmA (M78 family)
MRVRTLVKRLFINKKRKLSTTITPHLEEGNRQTEQESEKQCQFIAHNILVSVIYLMN